MWYYLQLSKPFAVGMLAMSILMLAILASMPPVTVLPLSIAVFVVSWIGQFIGHKIEGRKPSFLTDLAYLLIGPAWLVAQLMRRFGIAY